MKKPPGFAGRFCCSEVLAVIRHCRNGATTIRRGAAGHHLLPQAQERAVPGQGPPMAVADYD
jgi:hypothetical protein